MKVQTKAKLELIEYIDQEITAFIEANEGARTKDGVLAVFNSTLLLLHEIRADLYQDAQNEQEEFQAMTNVINILGGIR